MTTTAADARRRVLEDAVVLGARAPRLARRLGSHTASDALGAPEAQVLDPLPVVVDVERWSSDAAIVEQRARLAQAVLDDLYGPRRILETRLVPPEAVLADPNYLRPAIGLVPPPGRGPALSVAAVDLARSNGAPIVLADRLDVTHGIGLALEHRRALAAVHDRLHLELNPSGLLGWYAELRRAFTRASPEQVDDPRVVFLTPGAGWRGAAEHSYLARTLGFTVAEPGDLTVRDGALWFKSVGGAEPVHVVVRFVESVSCDPLELRGDAHLGVAGLLETVRRRTVAVANRPGAGIAENRVVFAHSATLCRELLGEEPLADTLPTWWCGNPVEQSYVLANLDRLIIRPVHAGGSVAVGRLLSRDAREELAGRISARGHLYVACAEIPLDTVPVWAGRVEQRCASMRLFTAIDGDTMSTMPGALTRSGGDLAGLLGATGPAHATELHDTWVVGARDHAAAHETHALGQVDLRASLSSRAAETMFWVGRNLERADAVIRLVRSIDQRVQQWPDIRWEANGAWWSAAMAAVATLAGVSGAPPTADLTGRALADSTAPRSLVTSLHHLLRGARSVTELFSADMWHVLGELTDGSVRLSIAAAHEQREAAGRLLTPLAALSGLASESMVRDPGWCFLDLGRRVERSVGTIDLLVALLGRPPDPVIAPVTYETALAATDSLVAYRRRYRSDIEPIAVADLVVNDLTNPRAVAYQVDRIRTDLARLPDRLTGGHLRVDTIEAEPWVATDRLWSIRSQVTTLSLEVELHYFAQIRSRTVRS